MATEKEIVAMDRVPSGDAHAPYLDPKAMDDYYEGKPTEEELVTLRRVAGNIPTVAYLICVVEFCERASYYGVQPLIGNFVNRPMPAGGNGFGAPGTEPGNQKTAGALGMGTVVANAVGQSFSMLAYILPLFFGWLADAKMGRFKLICWGVAVFGVAHVIMIAAGAPALLANGQAQVPYFISLYMLSVGAAIFKPNISPLLLDQIVMHRPLVVTLKSGERVIQDPESTAERVMLWFYLLINVGGFMGVATSYTAKYVGWWLSFLIPTILYMPLPPLLWFLKKRLVLHPAGGSDLPNVFRVLGISLRGAGLTGFGRHGFWEHAKPSVIAAKGLSIKTHWNDQFVEDVRRTFQATGIFCFFPMQYINDNGLGGAANFLSTALTTDGVPNDVLQNMNPLSIIATAPLLNYGLYPLLRKLKIHYGPASRIFTGLFMSSLAGAGYAILMHYAYQQSPCGYKATSGDDGKGCVEGNGVAPITIWYMAIPYAVGGISELFVNVPAFGIAYSRAPVNMRSLVAALNLFNTGVAYAIGLACSAAIEDPHLVWVFGGPAIVGGILAFVFYFTFRHINKEEYELSKNQDFHSDATGTRNVIGENETNATVNRPAPIADTEVGIISQKQ